MFDFGLESFAVRVEADTDSLHRKTEKEMRSVTYDLLKYVLMPLIFYHASAILTCKEVDHMVEDLNLWLQVDGLR